MNMVYRLWEHIYSCLILRPYHKRNLYLLQLIYYSCVLFRNLSKLSPSGCNPSIHHEAQPMWILLVSWQGANLMGIASLIWYELIRYDIWCDVLWYIWCGMTWYYPLIKSNLSHCKISCCGSIPILFAFKLTGSERCGCCKQTFRFYILTTSCFFCLFFCLFWGGGVGGGGVGWGGGGGGGSGGGVGWWWCQVTPI